MTLTYNIMTGIVHCSQVASKTNSSCQWHVAKGIATSATVHVTTTYHRISWPGLAAAVQGYHVVGNLGVLPPPHPHVQVH